MASVYLRGAGLVAAGALGAGIALGVGAAVWPDTTTTTVVEPNSEMSVDEVGNVIIELK